MARGGKGGKRPNWGSRWRLRKDGYIDLYRPGHPLARKDGYVMEHRHVLHEAGIEIPAGHHVHHRNGNKQDNRLENLEVLGASEHHIHHMRSQKTVRNQFGEFPILWGEERLERNRKRSREANRKRFGWKPRPPKQEQLPL